MKFRWEKKYLYWGITAFFVIVSSISFFILLNNFPVFMKGVQVVISILMPFILGFTFAYLLNPVMEFVENKWLQPLFDKHPPKNKKFKRAPRMIAVTIAVLFALAIITGLLVMVLPQLFDSIIKVATGLPTYFENFERWMVELVESNVTTKQFLVDQFDAINKFVSEWSKNNLLPQVNNIVSGITSGVVGVVSSITNLIIGVILSVYLLSSKEKFFAQTKKMLYSIFPVKAANVMLKTTRRADKIFGGFIIGKLIDSAIIGVICFCGMSIFNMPFPLLISTIIGITNIIPFFGPIIGAVPSTLLVLMVNPENPMTAVYFVIFIVILQQFDGNILGPKILGNSTGLSAFWVMFAILVGGGLFGFVGMLLGVPAFAVIYTIIVELSEARLKKQELPSKTADYYDIDYINNEEEPVLKKHVDDVKRR